MDVAQNGRKNTEKENNNKNESSNDNKPRLELSVAVGVAGGGLSRRLERRQSERDKLATASLIPRSNWPLDAGSGPLTVIASPDEAALLHPSRRRRWDLPPFLSPGEPRGRHPQPDWLASVAADWLGCIILAVGARSGIKSTIGLGPFDWARAGAEPAA